jgi:hypothetical protein
MDDGLNNSYDEQITELERKELENLGLYSDEEEDNMNNNKNLKKKEEKQISIFKSTDFNDFPKFDPEKKIKEDNNDITNNKFLMKNKINVKINNKNKIENNKIDERKNNEIIEEKDNIEEENLIKDFDDIDNEINLAEQLKQEYEGDYFKDKEKIKEDISDTELFSMSKENIIQYKNYQILKLKTIIKNLKQEKEVLIQNYKQTTDNLLKHIKELEFKGTGERPVTAKIIHKISTNNNDVEKNSEKNMGIGDNPNEKGLCPNCGKKIRNNFMEHSLECMRKKYRCIYCNELMNVEDKEKHNRLFGDKALMYKNIINKNCEFIIKALKHYFPINEVILDEKTGDYFIHLIIKYNIFNVIKKYDNVINVNLENKQKETPLFLAVNKNDINIVKELVCKGADIKKRNKADMSPLMICCKNNFQSIAEFLIKKGADVNEKNILGDTPVKLAQSNGNEELALKLIKLYKADIN